MKKMIFFLACAALPWPGAAAEGRHLVELFTSQGCSSCPPADRLLGKLLRSRDDIVALEFHVDYWDDLVHGLAGSWSDPFSDAAYTRRQYRYASRGLEGPGGVYTPQVVVDGRAAAVGSNESDIEALLDGAVPAAADVAVARDGSAMRVSVSGQVAGRAGVWFYIYDERQVTRVEAGENRGKTLTNHHVVREVRRLGDWQGGARSYTVDKYYLLDNRGCAVVVQRPEQGAVLGTGHCPS